MKLALVALFLPLFPGSLVLNMLLARLRAPFVRGILLLIWPQLGVSLLLTLQPEIPGFIVPWALLSATFYALRLLTVRDLALWAGFLASSALALTWGLAARGVDDIDLRMFVFWFSLPPALLMLLTGPIAQRLGAAYAGLFAGIADRQQRLAIALTLVVFSAVATPPFPGFFAMLALLRELDSVAMLAVLAIWLLWGWAATRVLQGFLSGNGDELAASDLERGTMAMISVVLAVFVVVGLQWTGGGL